MPDGNRVSYRALARGGLVACALLIAASLHAEPTIGAADHGRPPVTEHQSKPPSGTKKKQDYSAPITNSSSAHSTHIDAESKNKARYPKSQEGWWKKFTTDPTATFTAVLAMFTFALVGVSAWQGCQIKRAERLNFAALKSAQRQARASIRAVELSERALKKLEVPHIYPVDLKYFSDTREGVSGACFFAKFKNYGRAPAIMRYARLRAIVSPPNDLQKTLAAADKHFPLFGMVADRDVSDPIFLGPEPAFLPYEQAIMAGKMNLNLLVRVDWEDVFDNGASSSTWFVWDWRANKFVYGVQPPHDK